MAVQRVRASPTAPAHAQRADSHYGSDPFAVARILGNQTTATIARRDADQTFSDAKSGHSVKRIEVNGLTTGSTDMAMVMLPDQLPAKGGAIDILLYLHGHLIRGAHGYEEDAGGNKGDDIAFHKIPQQLAASGTNMMAILPQGGKKSQFNPPTAGPKEKGFDADAMIGEVFAQLTAMKAWGVTPPPTPGRVILSGHSGADVAISQMLSGPLGPKKLRGLFLFDTMWPNAGFQEKIWAAIKARLDQDLDAIEAIGNGAADPATAEQAQIDWIKANGFRLVDIFISGGTYDQESNELRNSKNAYMRGAKAKKVLGGSKSAIWKAMAANLVVEEGAGDHDHVVGKDDHLKKAIGTL